MLIGSRLAKIEFVVDQALVEMDIVFKNERNFWERTQLIVEKGVVYKKTNVEQRNWIVQRNENDHFLKTNDKKQKQMI